MRKLEILDGSWYVFRAYYWFPELTNDAWQNINAVYWFFRMLFTLWKRRPDEFVITWDSPQQTIRKKNFVEYKANRVSMPDEFKWQMRTIKDIVTDLGIPFLEIPWYEADDIIGTIVKKQQDKDTWKFQKWICIVSSDKDLKQLLADWVRQFDALKWVESTAQTFYEEYWFQPEQLVDYLSLLGDSSDNIPWVYGIWKKTAQQLIAQYGTIENIYVHIDTLQWSVQQKLLDGKDAAFMSKELVSLYYIDELRCDEDWSCRFDFDRFHTVLVDKYQFYSLESILIDLKKQRQGWQQFSLFG